MAFWTVLALACLGILGAVVAFLKTPREDRYRVTQWPRVEKVSQRLSRSLISIVLFLGLAAMYPAGTRHFIFFGAGYLAIDLFALLVLIKRKRISTDGGDK